MSPSIFSKKGLRVNLLPAITWKSTFFLAATLLLNSTFACLNATASPAAQELKKATRMSADSVKKNYDKVKKQIDNTLKEAGAAAGALGVYGLINQDQNERDY